MLFFPLKDVVVRNGIAAYKNTNFVLKWKKLLGGGAKLQKTPAPFSHLLFLLISYLNFTYTFHCRRRQASD